MIRTNKTSMNITLINLETLVLNTEAKFQGRKIHYQLSRILWDIGQKIYTILIITLDDHYQFAREPHRTQENSLLTVDQFIIKHYKMI